MPDELGINLLEFKISSKLKDIIGKDLITDDFIAVFELVKNSYDADANNVQITINNDEIIIADDGKGMSLDELKNKWLFVAYSAKRDGTEDETNVKKESYRDKIQERRHYAGSKGIGRFSSDRLGSKLSIITKKKQHQVFDKIDVDWKKFEIDQNLTFETVKIPHTEILESNIELPNNSKNGTILRITNLHSTWNRNQLKQLKHSLEKLINPFSESTDFSIEIICERELQEDNLEINGKPKYIDRDRINGKIKNSILEILNIKTTQISVEINKKEIVTEIIDRGTPIYSIKEENNEFSLLNNARIDLFFLNSSAKNNFTRKMGVRVVNFGSVFLFKNGFRVQPFGKKGDDSWGLDYRSQQGYNRYLGTRDIFGKVEIQTSNVEQFKEVSSRDGGLVETVGYHQLMKAFKEKGLIRLERYVVGVLWGEGFKKKKYFGEGKEAYRIADDFRKKLKDDDKISDNTDTVKSNLGSKLDFIQIIKSLATNKNIQIVNYNREFVNLINEKIDEYQTKFLLDLETIAQQTNDKELKKKIFEIEEKYHQLRREKEAAEEKAKAEEKARKEAEIKAKLEEEARKAAEEKARQAEEDKRKAELATLKKEKERAEAELAKLKAEKKAKEQEEAKKLAQAAELKAKQDLEVSEKKNLFLAAIPRDLSPEGQGLVHHIHMESQKIDAKLNRLLKMIKQDDFDKEKLYKLISAIKLSSDKTLKISSLITRANFNKKANTEYNDLAKFIIEYIEQYKELNFGDNSINFEITAKPDTQFFRRFSVLEVSIVLDNLISNAQKASDYKSTVIYINLEAKQDSLELIFSDNGNGVNPVHERHIFELGITTTYGSGIGLYMVKDILNSKLKSTIEFIGNNITGSGAAFKITFSK